MTRRRRAPSGRMLQMPTLRFHPGHSSTWKKARTRPLGEKSGLESDHSSRARQPSSGRVSCRTRPFFGLSRQSTTGAGDVAEVCAEKASTPGAPGNVAAAGLASPKQPDKAIRRIVRRTFIRRGGRRPAELRTRAAPGIRDHASHVTSRASLAERVPSRHPTPRPPDSHGAFSMLCASPRGARRCGRSRGRADS